MMKIKMLLIINARKFRKQKVFIKQRIFVKQQTRISTVKVKQSIKACWI